MTKTKRRLIVKCRKCRKRTTKITILDFILWRITRIIGFAPYCKECLGYDIDDLLFYTI